MLGAIIGDIVGSRFEWHNHRSKDFELLHKNCSFTDDSVMTLAVAKALINSKDDYHDLSDLTIKYMQEMGRKYPNSGYGGHFAFWLIMPNPKPYNSFGNGAAMRISSVGWASNSIEEVKKLSRMVTEVTHNHPEGIKGAESVAVSIFLARKGYTIEQIKEYVINNYYHIDFKLDDIRDTYQFNETCQGSVPQALEAFFESTSYIDAIRNAVSIGGDSDTIACIAGSIAEAYYGILEDIKLKGLTYLDDDLINILNQFKEKYHL